MDYSMDLPELINASNYKKALLEYAMYKSNNEFLHDLIEENCDLKDQILHLAARCGKIGILEHYISAEVDINRRGTREDNLFTPLQEAVAKNHLHVVTYLVESGAKVDIPCDGICYGNCSTLSIAINNQPKNLKMLKFLLKHGADANYSCDKCFTPLFRATRDNQAKIVKVLFNYGADINLPCNYFADQMTPLHMAVKNNQLEIVRLLLDENANVNAASLDSKKSVLHTGIPFAGPEIIEYVLSAGFDLNLVDCTNQTVVDLGTSEFYKFTSNIKEHLVKMKAADFHLREKNLKAIDSPEFSELLKSCCKEIEIMKKCTIAHTRVTFYDLLCIHEQVVALKFKCVRQKNILNYREKFPLYYEMIDYRLKRVLIRQNRLKKVNMFFEEIFWNLLPYTFIKNISSNLDESYVLKLNEQL